MNKNIRLYYDNPLIRGALAVFIWAAMAVIVVGLHRIPTLEMLSCSLLIAFACTCTDLTIRKKWSKLSISPLMLLVGSFAVAGTSALYIYSFKLAPPVHVELIMYVWPVLVLLGNVIFFGEKFSIKALSSVLVSIIALFMLHFDNQQWSYGFSFNLGYMTVFAAAITWTCYNLYTKHKSYIIHEMMGIYCGVGAVFIVSLHFLFEPTVIPNKTEIILLLSMGFFSQWFAYQAWDYAVKNTAPATLANLAYATPILSVILLTISGYGNFSMFLLVSCFLMSVSTFMLMPKHGSNIRENQ